MGFAKVIPILIDISEDDQNSEAVDISDFKLFSLQWPASMTGTGVAIQANSPAGWVTLAVEGGSDVSVAKNDGALTGLDDTLLELASVSTIRLVSTANEVADRQFYLHCKG